MSSKVLRRSLSAPAPNLWQVRLLFAIIVASVLSVSRPGRSDPNTRISPYFTGAKVFTSSQTANGQPGTTGGALGGTYGFYGKQIIAPSAQHVDVVVANVNETVQYEPVSAIKILPALKLMRDVQAGNVLLHSGNGTQGSYYNVAPGASCPGETTSPEWMGQLLSQMMLNSDNGATKGIIKFEGDLGAITNFAHQIGLANTTMTGYVGCLTSNRSTLSDLGLLYEGIANGNLLNSSTANTLYANMADDGADDFDAKRMAIQNIINVDGASPVLSDPQRQAFTNAFDLHNKWGWGGNSSVTHWAVSGSAVIPTCFASHRTLAAFDRSQTQYVWGAFIDNEIRALGDFDTIRFGFLEPVQVEPLRESFDAALSAWASCADVAFWGDSSLPTNSPLGDWANGLYKAECLPNQALVGISKDTRAPHAHRALCAENSAAYNSSTRCYALSFSQGSFQGTFDGDFLGGDWDPNYFKGECGPSEYVAGVAQETHPITRNGTSYPSQLDTILCCPAVRGDSTDPGSVTHSACEVETFHNGDSTHNAAPDWDVGFYRGQCAQGKYVAGVSAGSFIAGTDPGAPHALLCCAP